MAPDPKRILREDPKVERPVLLPRLLDEFANRVALVVARDEEIRRRDPNIVLVREAPGDRRVARTIDVLVMVEVVRRDPGEDRVAVERGDRHRERLIGALVRERRAVVVVVRDDAAREREVRVQPKEVRRERRAGEFESHERGGEEHPEKRPIVGGEAGSHESEGRAHSSAGRPLFGRDFPIWQAERRGAPALSGNSA